MFREGLFQNRSGRCYCSEQRRRRTLSLPHSPVKRPPIARTRPFRNPIVTEEFQMAISTATPISTMAATLDADVFETKSLLSGHWSRRNAAAGQHWGSLIPTMRCSIWRIPSTLPFLTWTSPTVPGMREQLIAYAEGEPVEFCDVELSPKPLTTFRCRVLTATRRIPRGQTKPMRRLPLWLVRRERLARLELLCRATASDRDSVPSRCWLRRRPRRLYSRLKGPTSLTNAQHGSRNRRLNLSRFVGDLPDCCFDRRNAVTVNP